MKKSIIMALVACLLVSLMPGLAVAEDSRLRVVTTIFPPYDFVREIAGDAVDLQMLLPPGGESHSFEPSPQDTIRIQNCDLFIHVGGHGDAWVERIMASMDGQDITVLRLIDMVDEVLEEDHEEGMPPEEDDHDHEAHADEGEDHGHDDHDHAEEAHTHEDEHVWTSPRNAMLIVGALTDALAAMDEGNADAYHANAAAYTAELAKLDAAFEAAVAEGSRTTILFADRFPFRYLADAYGLTYYAAFPGCANETEASASTIAFLIDKTREEKLPAVFTIEFSNGKIADVICESSDAVQMSMHSAHNVSKQDFDAGVGYLDLMWQNAEALREALK